MKLTEFLQEKLFLGTSTLTDKGINWAPASALPYKLEYLLRNSTANRCFNMIVDSAAGIPYEVKKSKIASPNSKLQPQSIEALINRKPNSRMDANFFWRKCVSDLLGYGNSYILVKDNELFYVPADSMIVYGSATKLVDRYEFTGAVAEDFKQITFKPEEIIHIKDNGGKDLLKGESRFTGLTADLNLYEKMKSFQGNFFDNSAIPGIVFESPNTLTAKVKQRKIAEWKQDFNPLSGARSPAFLDGGITMKNLSKSTFKEMDFENSAENIERKIAKGMGVPYLLLDGGNNANITPNLRLFYIETIVPINKKIVQALSLHFGYEIVISEASVTALQPDLRELGNYLSTLVNAGIMTPNEAREKVGLELHDDEEMNKVRIPANIAGSNADPSQGGRPPSEEE
jgi:HK97 family phage portal protein